MISEVIAQLRAAHSVKEGFQIVREVAQGVEMQEAGRALEGVKGAKDRIDCGRIGGIFLEHEDTLLNALQQLHRLAVEFSQKSKFLCEVEADRWLLGA